MNLELSLQAFRTFRDRQRVQLRPLTLVYGHNQAGKSTLLRVLPLLADALAQHGGGLDLRSAALRGATLRELGWLGVEPIPRPTVGMRAGAADDASRIEWAFTEEDGLAVPGTLRIGRADWTLDVRLDRRAGGELSAFTGMYSGTLSKEPWSGELRFTSLLPSAVPEALSGELGELQREVRWLMSGQWLQANRLVGASGRPSRFCRPDGSDLAPVFQRLPRGRQLLARASALLQEIGLKDQVVLGLDSDGRPRLEARRPDRLQLPVHLAGEGYRAVLPIALLLAWGLDEETRERPRWLAVEEPESHLHPDVQVKVADQLVAAAGAGLSVFLETHSPTILRAVQLAVLQRRLAPQDLGLYWVDQAPTAPHQGRVRRVDVDGAGVLHGWDPRVFGEDQALARQILDARLERLEAEE
ncbi:MAG: AAA family ATPase [Deltaproteobacteria bacterium]|nr:AAA family ATPase [Deltaproteobacteria bacterium]